MTAKEWLGVIQQAEDYDPAMTNLIVEYGRKLLAENSEKVKSITEIHDKYCLLFAEWLRINFNNSPEESDNYWVDLFYTVDKIKQNNYTTEELYLWWTNNV